MGRLQTYISVPLNNCLIYDDSKRGSTVNELNGKCTKRAANKNIRRVYCSAKERWLKKPQKALPQQYITVLEFVLGSLHLDFAQHVY
jgi:hypothetical protein